MKTLNIQAKVSIILLFILFLFIFSFTMVSKDIDSAYAAAIEVSGTIKYSATTSPKYNGLNQVLGTGFTAIYTVNTTNYNLVEGSHFVYKDGSIWQFKAQGSESFVDLDTQVNNFKLAGVYKREVRVYDRTDFKPKTAESTFFEYTIAQCVPEETVANSYRASVGMKLSEVILPLGWSMAENTPDLNVVLLNATTKTNIILNFVAPVGTEINFDLDPVPGTKTITVEVLLKPEIIFKGTGTSQVTLSTGINYSSETNRYSGNIITNTFTRVGYNFKCFTIDGDNSGMEYSKESNATETMSPTFDLAPVAKVIFTAQWSPRDDTKYKIEHYRQGLTDEGSYLKRLSDTQTHQGTTETVVTLDVDNPAEPKIWKMDGFTYNPVKTRAENNFSGTIKADGSLVLKMYYDRDEYSVEYTKGNDILGTLPADSNKYKYEERITLASAATLSKPGYTFVGWTDGISKVGDDLKVFTTGIKYTMIAPLDENDVKLDKVTFVANFTPNKDTPYTIRHFLPGTTASEDVLLQEQVLSGETDKEISALAVVAGYKKIPDFASQNGRNYPEKGVIKADGSLVLAIYYEIVDYIVTFNYGTSELLPSETKNINNTITLPVAPDKEGYTFDSWKINGVSYEPGEVVTVLGSMRVDAIYLSTSGNNTTGDVENNNIFVVRAPEGLSTGAIVGIAVSGAVVLGASIFSIVWFGVMKKTFKDMKLKRKKKKSLLN